MTSPTEMPVSTRTPGPGRQAHELDRAGRGREVLLGVLGVEPGLDGVAELRAAASPSSRPPSATCSCSLTRSRPVVASVTGCSTCSRVLTSRKVNSFSSGW